MKKKKLRLVLMAVLAILFVFSAGQFLYHQLQYSAGKEIYADAARLAGITGGIPKPAAVEPPAPRPEEPAEDTAPTPVPTLEPVPPELGSLAGVDVAALQAVNPETIGWIAIPGTDLSYPLMAHEDNEYYLTHSWNNEYNICGSVFLECMNSPELTDYHTIVYGHRMNNDSMFGMLRFYQDDAYRREYPSIYVVCGDELRRYDIFAVYEADVEGIVYHLNLEEKNRQKEFIASCLENSVIDTGLEPSPQDQILTLSTCPARGYDSRLVVQGYLAKAYRIP